MKLSLKQISTAYLAGSVTSVATGYVLAALWDRLGGHPDYALVIGGTWLLTVGVPSSLVSADSIRRQLGERKPAHVSAAGSARRVPIHYKSGTVTTFLSSMLPGNMAEDSRNVAPPILPNRFTIHGLDWSGSGNPVDIELTETAVRGFVQIAWHRQMDGKAPFSRPYWTRRRRPSMPKDEYFAAMYLLESHGLVINRGPGRSGRLALQPRTAIRHLKYSYGLQHV